MKLLAHILLVAAAVFSIGCGKKKSEKEANPSIKGAYQAQADFVMATLNETRHFGRSEYDFLTSKIVEMRDLVPMNGIAQKYTLDNLEAREWNLKGQPAVKINSIATWVICNSQFELPSSGSLSVDSEIYNSRKSWDVPALRRDAYVSRTPTFDYGNKPAQYRKDIGGELILKPLSVSVSTIGYDRGGVVCAGPRSVLSYTGFSGRTLSAVNQFKATMDSALKDLEDIVNNSHGNYPVSYMLNAVRSKIAKAVSALP